MFCRNAWISEQRCHPPQKASTHGRAGRGFADCSGQSRGGSHLLTMGWSPWFGEQHSRLMWALELWNPSLWGLPAPGIGVCQHTECTVVILQGRNALGTFSSPERPKSLLNFQCAPVQQTVIKMWKKGNCHQSISMNYSRNFKYHWHRMIMVRFGSVNILGFRWPRWTFAQPC